MSVDWLSAVALAVAVALGFFSFFSGLPLHSGGVSP